MCDSINRGNYPEESLLVGAAESVWKGSDARVNISIDVGQRLADTIGEEIEGQLECAFITDSDIRHIRRKHGANEERRGQQSIVPNDFALIPKVLNESDACDHADGQGGQQEVPREKGDRGTAYLVTAQRGKGKLEVKMMRKAHRSGASC